MNLTSEAWLRVGASVGVFLVMALWELLAPWRELAASKPRRWLRNFALVTIDTLAVRLVAPAGAVGLAWLAEQRGWGLFQVLELSLPIAGVLGFLLLDLTIYLQHVAMHAVPMLWRLHLVHHSDVDVDVTTGNRFHPLEILLSMGIKDGVVIAAGVPAPAVLLFEVVLNATSLFNHSNVELPAPAERLLRAVLVTPAMHRVHHSVERSESNRNFGFNFSWWDRLLGTYLREPAAEPRRMPLGVAYLRNPERQTLPWLLSLPFQRPGS